MSTTGLIPLVSSVRPASRWWTATPLRGPVPLLNSWRVTSSLALKRRWCVKLRKRSWLFASSSCWAKMKFSSCIWTRSTSATALTAWGRRRRFTSVSQPTSWASVKWRWLPVCRKRRRPSTRYTRWTVPPHVATLCCRVCWVKAISPRRSTIRRAAKLLTPTITRRKSPSPRRISPRWCVRIWWNNTANRPMKTATVFTPPSRAKISRRPSRRCVITWWITICATATAARPTCCGKRVKPPGTVRKFVPRCVRCRLTARCCPPWWQPRIRRKRRWNWPTVLRCR